MGLMQPGDTFASLTAQGRRAPQPRHEDQLLGHLLQPRPLPPALRRVAPPASSRSTTTPSAPSALSTSQRCSSAATPRTAASSTLRSFREIADECGAILMADIAHIAGLVAGGAHPSPFPHCHVVTTTTHKSLRGPRGGLILTNDEEIAKKINKALFPGVQGGPLMHVVLAKAVAFGEALKPRVQGLPAAGHHQRQGPRRGPHRQGLPHLLGRHRQPRHARRPHRTRREPDRRRRRDVARGRRHHLQQERHPQRPAPPVKTSGIRLGTPATTTRGFGEAEMATIASFIDRVLSAGLEGEAQREQETAAVRAEVRSLCEKFPMPGAVPLTA
jgi:glycine hydroxymethyltransferase